MKGARFALRGAGWAFLAHLAATLAFTPIVCAEQVTGDGSADLMRSRLVAWRGLPDEARTARAELAVAAQQGQSEAAYTLGNLHYAGVGMRANRDIALDWWRQAADANHREANYNIGLTLLHRGDNTKAIDHLTRAATAEHALACFALGTWLAEGGIELTAATRWLECASRQGYAPAQYNLAKLYLAATAPGPAPEKALQWLNQAAPSFNLAANLLAQLELVTVHTTESSTPTPAASASAIPTVVESSEEISAKIHDLAWVETQSPAHYTVQVASGTGAAAMKRMLRDHAANVDSAYFLHRPAASEPYTAVIGAYGSYADAVNALSALPAFFQRNTPWIRRFGTLQKELAGRGETVVTEPP